jgi:hypothetical protein
MSYQPLTTAAQNAKTSESTLLEFGQAGWIQVIRRNGCLFVSGHDAYRARFVLCLRQKLELTDRQIGIVLDHQGPPYSLAEVPAILADYADEA